LAVLETQSLAFPAPTLKEDEPHDSRTTDIEFHFVLWLDHVFFAFIVRFLSSGGGTPMTATEVLAQLKKLGSEQTKKTFLRHGAKEPFFGVKVADLKTLQKKLKTNHALALELYDSGNSDAMYLAGMIADPAAFTKADLRKWVKAAYWHMLSGHVVPWVASESRFGRELALEWMDSDSEMIANAGWSTYSSLVSIKPDADLDLAEIETLLGRIKDEINDAPNRVRYSMNGFIIAVGSFVAPMVAKAKATAKALGTVEVDMGDTSCNVPDACAYIAKVEKTGRVGKKRKHAGC
jgi:3-methyladenine DNA glycosylase AlkD